MAQALVRRTKAVVAPKDVVAAAQRPAKAPLEQSVLEPPRPELGPPELELELELEGQRRRAPAPSALQRVQVQVQVQVERSERSEQSAELPLAAPQPQVLVQARSVVRAAVEEAIAQERTALGLVPQNQQGAARSLARHRWAQDLLVDPRVGAHRRMALPLEEVLLQPQAPQHS